MYAYHMYVCDVYVCDVYVCDVYVYNLHVHILIFYFLHLAYVGYQYAGLQYNDLCYCGYEYYTDMIIDDSWCNVPCVEHSIEICGGIHHLSVYSTFNNQTSKLTFIRWLIKYI